MTQNAATHLKLIYNSNSESGILNEATISDITKRIMIHEFGFQNELHLRLYMNSKKAHELGKRYYEQNDAKAQEELNKVEKEMDKTVAKPCGVTDEELK